MNKNYPQLLVIDIPGAAVALSMYRVNGLAWGRAFKILFLLCEWATMTT